MVNKDMEHGTTDRRQVWNYDNQYCIVEAMQSAMREGTRSMCRHTDEGQAATTQHNKRGGNEDDYDNDHSGDDDNGDDGDCDED